MNAAILELLLRSAKAPPAVIELAKLFAKEGFGAMKVARMPEDDPNWQRIKADPAKSQRGVWVQAEASNSRVTAAIFLEGANDEILKGLESLGAVPRALPAGAEPTV